MYISLSHHRPSKKKRPADPRETCPKLAASSGIQTFQNLVESRFHQPSHHNQQQKQKTEDRT